MMRIEEQRLIKELLARNEGAFARFYSSYSPKVHNFILKKVSNEKDAEEILQDVLFAFLEKVRDFNGTSSLSTYLCAIAHHKVIDYYRKKRLKQVLFSQLPDGVAELFAYMVTPDKEFDHKELREKIAHVLNRLEPRHKRLILMKYRDGFSVEEMAVRLSCSFKSAESGLFRARQTFKKVFVNS